MPLRLTYTTPLNILDNIKIGDLISDAYQLMGKVIKIEKITLKGNIQFIFTLDNYKSILMLR
ncbi:hypothetical protein [Pedobacter aquatilis]|uniref:hypothetical protein n=1 Tax=Pedobacter aquatilis TaxID=351343 RepID=UPI00292DB492|nr:hypothetical protein [Pedobacter aquatilis]